MNYSLGMSNPLADFIAKMDEEQRRLREQNGGGGAGAMGRMSRPVDPMRTRELVKQLASSGRKFDGRTAAMLAEVERQRAADEAQQQAVQAQQQPQMPPAQAPVQAPQMAQEPPRSPDYGMGAQQPLPPQQAALSQQQPVQQPSMPGNNLQGHIGDRGDAIRALQAQQQGQQVNPAGGQENGFLSGLSNAFGGAGDFRSRLGDAMMGMAAGENMNDSMRLAGLSMMKGNQLRRQEQKALAATNKTREYAIRLGIPADAAGGLDMPNLMELIRETHKRQSEPIKVGEGETLYDPTTRQPIVQGKAKQTDDLREYEFAKSQGYQGSFADYQLEMRRAGALTIDQRAESAFERKAGEDAAKRFGDIVEAGRAANQSVADIQTLRDLGQQIGTGKQAEIIAALGPYADALGMNITGLGEMQAYEAIAAKIAPTMRVPGTGATSDFEMRQFFKALPSLGRTPEGNKIVEDTLDAMYKYRIAAADIASRALSKELTPREAEQQLRALPDPMTLWKDSQKKTDQNSGRSSSGIQWRVE